MEDAIVVATKLNKLKSGSSVRMTEQIPGRSTTVVTVYKRRSEKDGIPELVSINVERDIPGVMATTFKRSARLAEHRVKPSRKVIGQVQVISAKKLHYVISSIPGLFPRANRDFAGSTALQIPYVPLLTSDNAPEAQSTHMVSEMDLLRSTIEVAGRSLHLLKDAPAQVHPIKAFHNVFMKRQFAVVTFVKDAVGFSRRFFGFVWQTVGGKSPHLICVTFSFSKGQLYMSCSCDPMRTTHCEHARCCLGTELYKFACQSLNRGVQFAEYFGHCSSHEVTDFTVVELVRKKFIVGRISSQGTSQEWSCWMVFDNERNLFVPVTKRLKKKFQCQACRGSSYKRADCHHEVVCFNMSIHRTHKNCEVEDNVDGETEELRNTSGVGDRADIEKYCCQDQRPLLPCPKEKSRMKDLTFRILYSVDAHREKSELEGVDPATRPVLTLTDWVKRCSSSQCSEKRFNGISREREAYLFTLGHGTVFVAVTDWTCSNCEKDVIYTGLYDSVFPVRKESLYTTELMYALVTNVFRWGISLRAAYGTLVTYMKSASNVRVLTESEKRAEAKRSRRRVAEAFRFFISTLHTEDTMQSTSPRFLNLFSCDVCQVELNSDDRRMLGLTEDDLPGSKRYKGIVIDGTSAGISAEVPHYDRKQAILKAPKRLKDSKLVHFKETKASLSILFMISQECFRALRRRKRTLNVVSFKLQPRLSKKQIDILRHSMNGYSCGCQDHAEIGMEVRHSRKCKDFQRLLISSNEINAILKKVFEIKLVATNAMTENVSAGNESQTDSGDSEADIEMAEIVSDGRCEEATLQWEARIVFANAAKMCQLLDSLFELLKFIAIENCAMVYIIPATHTPATISPETSRPSGNDSDSCEFSSNGRPHRSTVNMSQPSVRLHEDLCSALENLSECTHSRNSIVCEACIENVCNRAQSISNVNIVLYRFCYELIPVLRATPSTAVVELCESVALVCRMHIDFAQNFFAQLDAKISDDCEEYTRSYGSILVNQLENCSSDSGICFPDLSMYRPHILFEVKEKHHCTKKYPKSLRFSPGVLSVECVCKHPKCLGFIIMTKAESTALALSAIISHFRLPPRAVYYDNGCNLFSSALTRVPWLLHITRIAIDRFHFKGHKCSSFFDADFYSFNDGQRTSAAEAINSKLKKAISSMRYLAPESMIDYLKCRFAIANVESMFRERLHRADLEDEDLSVSFILVFLVGVFYARYIL